MAIKMKSRITPILVAALLVLLGLGLHSSVAQIDKNQQGSQDENQKGSKDKNCEQTGEHQGDNEGC